MLKSQYRVKAKSKVLPCAKEPAKTKQQQAKADTCIHQHIKQNILKCFPHPIWGDVKPPTSVHADGFSSASYGDMFSNKVSTDNV